MELKNIWEKTSSLLNETKDSLNDFGSDIISTIQEWIVNLFINAIHFCSTEEDRLEIISWLALVREIIDNPSFSMTTKTQKIYHLIDSTKTVQVMFRSVITAVDNYKNSELPLPVKVAIPVTLTAATIVGGQGAGIAFLGGAIGMPVLLLIFIGTAGITNNNKSQITPKYTNNILTKLLTNKGYNKSSILASWCVG